MRALRRALAGLREQPLLAMATSSAVAVVLTLTGTFVLVVSNLSGVLDQWGKDVQIWMTVAAPMAKPCWPWRCWSSRPYVMRRARTASYVSPDTPPAEISLASSSPICFILLIIMRELMCSPREATWRRWYSSRSIQS